MGNIRYQKGRKGVAALLVYGSEKPKYRMDQFQLLRGRPALNDPAINQREHELLPATEDGFENVEFHGLVAQEPHEVIEEFAAGMFNLARTPEPDVSDENERPGPQGRGLSPAKMIG